jgi:hypothetical protein
VMMKLLWMVVDDGELVWVLGVRCSGVSSINLGEISSPISASREQHLNNP